MQLDIYEIPNRLPHRYPFLLVDRVLKLEKGKRIAPRVGRATDPMMRFRAGEFGVARSDIELVFGRRNVNKQLRIEAPTVMPAGIEWPGRNVPGSKDRA